MLTFCCVLEAQGVKMLLVELWPFHTGQNNCFSPLDRHTSTMMTHSTSTMLRLKQRLATTRKQKRCGALPEKPTFKKKQQNFIESFELLGFLTTVISFFFQYFLLIQNEKFKNDYVYLSWLARCCMYQNLHIRLVHTFSPVSPHDFVMFPAPNAATNTPSS